MAEVRGGFGQLALAQVMGFELSGEQLPIVLGPLSDPSVVIAGAGSGKTTLMAARMMTLVARGDAEPEEILGLTFTRKAASELAARIDRWLREGRRKGLVPEGPGMPEVSTYHSFAQRLVREHGLRAGIDPDRRLETDFTLRPLVYRTVSSLRELASVRHGLRPGSAVAGVVRLDSELAEHSVSTDQLRAAETRRLHVMEAIAKPTVDLAKVVATSKERILLSYGVDAYREAKDREGVMDFADLMRFADQICQSTAEVAMSLRATYAAVLLDEYQDTSVVQRRILQNLFGGGHPVMAVGDPKQSIYSFRGAAAENIEAFPEHFPLSSGEPSPRHTLSANFRSGAAILNTANDLAMSAGIANSTGLVAGGGHPSGAVEALLFDSRHDEEVYLVDQVAGELARGRQPGEILVLASRNSDVRRLAAELTSADIAVSASDVAGLWEVPEVQDVLAVLGVLADPGANTDLVRLLVGPRWRVGVRDLALLGDRANEIVESDADNADRSTAASTQTPTPATDQIGAFQEALNRAVAGSDPVDVPSLLAALLDPGELPFSEQALTRFGQFRREFERLSEHVADPITDLISRVIHETGLDVEVLLGPRSEVREGALEALISLAAGYVTSDPTGGLAGFLRAIRIARASDLMPDFDPPEPTGAVRVMTVHKAKGLEAQVVFLPGMSQKQYDKVTASGAWTTTPGALPDDIRGDRPLGPDLAPTTNKELKAHVDGLRALGGQERSRLTYVAVTRAGARLVLSSHHWTPGLKNATELSGHFRTMAAGAHVIRNHWDENPSTGNPAAETSGAVAFPDAGDGEQLRSLREAAAFVAACDGVESVELTAAEFDLVADWDRDLAALERERAENDSRQTSVTLPDQLSVTAAQALVANPESFAEGLRRPMPRPPSVRADRGTRFHEWVAKRWDQHPLVDPLEGAADAELAPFPDEELLRLQEAFERSEFADRAPAAIEYPFTITIGGIPISGQIDAVYVADDGWEVVDWKTGRLPDADPLQLAIYRIAWAQLRGVPLEQVTASFYYVSRAERVVQSGLPSAEVVADLLRDAQGSPE